jgi:hypothetical protein
MKILKDSLRQYKFYIIFLGAVAAALFLLFLIRADYYPIVFVNNQPISAREFAQNYQLAATYYRNIFKTYNFQNSGQEMPGPIEIQAGILTQLIEAKIIEEGAKKETRGDIAGLVAEKIDKYEHNEEFRRAVETLYGASFEYFKKAVLIPQAERDILAGRLFLRGVKLAKWLEEEKKSSRVIIFSRRFRWNGQDVEVRE